MLDIRVFSPLCEDSTLQQNQLAKIGAQRVTFTEDLYNVGSFTVELSGNQNNAEKLHQGCLISFKGDNVYLWGVVRGIDDQNNGFDIPIVRSGEDLCGFLKQRICLYPQESDVKGYDTVKGSTETVMKHYIKNNVTAPVDSSRKIPSFIIAPDQGRGLKEDKYMARFNLLTDLLSEVGQAQKIGWKVDMDLSSGKMVFDVVQGTDRTAYQDNNPRIIFDVNLKTAQNSRYVKDMSSFRNAFYTSKSGAITDVDAVTLPFYREDTAEPFGINRFETQISVSVGNDVQDIIGEMKNLSKKQMTNFEMGDTFTIELNNNYIYNKDFFLGDFVTVQDRFMGISQNVQLVCVQHEWTGIAYCITGTFGKPRKTNLQLIERQIKTQGGR